MTMRTRTTKKEMELAVRLLNEDLGLAAGVEGEFVLQGAYGGWQLARRAQGTAISNIPGMYGYYKKREVAQFVETLRLGVKYGTLMCHGKV